MDIPLWAEFGVLVAFLSAAMMLVQERLKIPGFAMAFWNKVACAVLVLPAVLYFGIPENPYFYVLCVGQAFLWVISDVIFFNAIPKVGAGVVSRLLPLSTLLTFTLWFVVDPDLVAEYAKTPWRSGAVVVVLGASVFFAMRLKRCPVSWAAFRQIAFVIFAATVGPIGFKLISQQAEVEKGAFSFIFCEALVMIVSWLVWQRLKKPIPNAVLFSWPSARGGFMLGSISSLMVASNYTATFYVDNPALIHAIRITDALLIIAFYKATGRKESADVWSGLGIAACAVTLIVLKSL